MADTAPANKWTWLTSLSPTINTVASALVGLMLGVGGLAGYQAWSPAKPIVIPAADAPKPQASAQLEQAIGALSAVADEVRALKSKVDALDARLPAPVPPPKRTPTASAPQPGGLLMDIQKLLGGK